MFARILLIVAVAFGLSACASKIKRYDGPAVSLIQVQKANRRMYLLHEGEVLKAYDISLGFAPTGHKQFEGDGRTPEGTYMINRRNMNSQYHLSLGISYPNAEDIAFALREGKQPGGDIFIHGWRRSKGPAPRDWTAGCIAVQDHEIEEIYSMVRDGTPVQILP